MITSLLATDLSDPIRGKLLSAFLWFLFFIYITASNLSQQLLNKELYPPPEILFISIGPILCELSFPWEREKIINKQDSDVHNFSEIPC